MLVLETPLQYLQSILISICTCMSLKILRIKISTFCLYHSKPVELIYFIFLALPLNSSMQAFVPKNSAKVW